MSAEPHFTHVGWLMFCPIKVANPECDAPCLVARWWWLEWLLSVALFVQWIVIGLCTLAMDEEDYEPGFYFKITGEIRE